MDNEEQIHNLYDNIQKRNEASRMQRRVSSENPNPLNGRQPIVNNPARNTQPSFRSQYFDVGEGLKTLAPGETRVMAKITIAAEYGGVLTGFSQYFADCGEDNDITQTIKWGLRINGLPVIGFVDFVGELSSLMIPRAIYFPLVGGAITLGESEVSLGGHIVGEDNHIPTVAFLATNNNPYSVVLQGRLVGYTFAVAERNDEFQNF